MPEKYTIGTRGSLLALTQCGQVKKQLEELSDAQFELKIIKTQGDQIQDKALWQMEGKDFFTKELDDQLMAGKIDLVVHSYKDLGSERPEEIQLSALTQRQIPHDILLIKNSKIEELKNIKEFTVGTSSPRRIANIQLSFKDFFPYSENIKFNSRILRGNVNSRIEKLRNDEYDAIILAFAGLERLAITESSREKLKALLKGLNFMVLPLKNFPPAASQGVLAIETASSRSKSDQLLKIIKKLHCSHTEKHSKIERSIFQSYGGGCHLPLGIFSNEQIKVIKGKFQDKSIFEYESVGKKDEKILGPKFLGLPNSKLPKKDLLGDELLLKKEITKTIPNAHILMASTYGLKNLNSHKSLFSSGEKTWEGLKNTGHWVNASHEGLGEEFLDKILSSKLLAVFHPDLKSDFYIATNKDSHSKLGKIWPCYERVAQGITQEYRDKLESCQSFYWTSFFQYQLFCQYFPSIVQKRHYCGPGKTLEHFEKNGLEVISLSTIEDFI